MNIAYAKHVLDNGLQVLVHEDRNCPIVAVNLWYHVGSKNERPQHTGFAHLFEHLMFEGSQHYDRGFFHPLQQAGGVLNGSTNSDRTNYWEVVPRNTLELALWMESDRMGYLLPALTEAKFENQRDVVLERAAAELREPAVRPRLDGPAGRAVPPDHPYHWSTIGEVADLHAATLDQAHEFFRAYYHPANASLVIAGDVDTAEAFEQARRYFEAIPPGPPVTQPSATAALDGEVRLLLEDRVEMPRLYLTWHSPAMFTDGDAEMDLLSDLLANGKTSRLYRRLVYERRIATDVSSLQNSRELSGFFQLIATPTPEHTLAELDEEISGEIDRLIAEGPLESELERSRAQVEANFVYRLQTVGGFGGKSDQLNAYNVFLGEPGYFDRDLALYLQATGADVRAAAARYLSRGRRIALSVVPQGRADLAVPGSERTVAS